MGLVTLALIGGAGYIVVKKVKKHNRMKQLQNGQCPRGQAREVDDFHGDFNATQNYYDSTTEKAAPAYHETAVPAQTYPNEKGGMTEIKN